MMQHMIGDVVPLATQPMIAYLTSKTKQDACSQCR